MQDAAQKPECSHTKHLCGTNCLNSLVQSCTCFPCCRTSALRVFNMEEVGVQSVECEVWSVESKV